jgi:hypothetical protein
VSWACEAPAVGDFDGDGRPDLVFGDEGIAHGAASKGRVYVSLSSDRGW